MDTGTPPLQHPGPILVTGATGFIGRRLCAALQDQGHQVTAAVRQPPTPALACPWVTVGAINDRTDWSSALPHTKVVIHLAAKVHDLEQQSGADYTMVNELGTARLARAAAAAGVRRFILASSVKAMAEYSRPGEPLTEEMAPRPEDDYGRSKLAAEQRLKTICHDSGMEWTILRLPLVYGPGVKANMARLLQAVAQKKMLPLGGIDNRRSLLSCTNCISCIIRCLGHPQAANHTFLVSDQESCSTPQLIRYLAAGMNLPPRLLPVPASLFRITAAAGRRLGRLTGSATVVSLAGALSRLSQSLEIDATKCRRQLQWTPPQTLQDGLIQMAQDFNARQQRRRT